MSATTSSPSEALADRLFESAVGALELFSVHLGRRLGLYDALAAASGPLTPGGLAAAAGMDERYAREWLEQQAVAGLIAVEDAHAAAGDRAYRLPEGHAAVLCDPDDPAHAAPLAPMVVGIAGALPDVVEAYRTGEGVPYARYGADFRDGQGAINAPTFIHDLPAWIAAAGLDERLHSGPAARVADVGCGLGHSTAALASAYPGAQVEGLDLDPASVEDAQARHPGVAFRVADAEDLGGPFDLVTVFEALHDMSRPVEALMAARRALAPGGAVLLADERVADEFTAPGDLVERVMYGWSVTHCLPSSRAEQPSAALGTALRASTVRALATEAGFSEVDELDVEHPFFRVYRLRG